MWPLGREYWDKSSNYSARDFQEQFQQQQRCHHDMCGYMTMGRPDIACMLPKSRNTRPTNVGYGNRSTRRCRLIHLFLITMMWCEVLLLNGVRRISSPRLKSFLAPHELSPSRQRGLAKLITNPPAKLGILHLITSLDIGGAEMQLAKLLARTDPARFQACVVCLINVGSVGGENSRTRCTCL